jgi:hypothetical protein
MKLSTSMKNSFTASLKPQWLGKCCIDLQITGSVKKKKKKIQALYTLRPQQRSNKILNKISQH